MEGGGSSGKVILGTLPLAKMLIESICAMAISIQKTNRVHTVQVCIVLIIIYSWPEHVEILACYEQQNN